MAHHRRFHRVRHHAGRAMAGAKGTLFGVAAGAGTAAVAGYAQTAVPFLASGGWWAMPAALALVGHFLKRRNPTIGGAITGIAGYLAYANFVSSRSAKGFIDAGYLDAGDTRYIDSPGTTASMGTSAAQNAGMLISREAMGADAGILVDARDSVMGLEA